jgi:prevent-host-death family protein
MIKISRTLQLREAKASLSAVVDAAERGEATTITRRGRAAAVVMPVGMAEQMLAKERPSFANLLLAIPGGFEAARDHTPLRDLDP